MGLEALTSLAVANTLRALVLGGVTSNGEGGGREETGDRKGSQRKLWNAPKST